MASRTASRRALLRAAGAALATAFALVALGAPAAPVAPAAPAAAQVRFENVAARAGVDHVVRNSETPERYQIEPMIAGVALFDYDNDGRLDIYFCNGATIPGLEKSNASSSNRLYRNGPGLVFEDVTARAGVAGAGYSMGAAAGDYDNDGWTDLYVTGVNRNILYHNRGDGTFEDVTSAAGVAAELPGRGKIHELDSAYRNAQVPVERRLGMLQSHHETLAADVYTMPLASEIELLALTGEYEKALALMRSHRFRIWEGGEGLHTTFVDANVLRGFELLKAGKVDGARPFFEAAAEFPLNLEAKKYYASGRSSEVFYHQGVFYEAAGQAAEARRAFRKAVAERQYYHSYGVPHYYRGQALKKLGRPAEAKPLFEALIERGTRELAEIETSTGISFFAKFGDLTTDEIRQSRAHYLMGLGYLGLEDQARAKVEFDQAARLDIYNLWAKVMSSQLD
jgi:tetratricopeptide (TPR) repeat protein